jgi:receptor protein-tyrosine kinase
MQTPTSWAPQPSESYLDLRDYLAVLKRRRNLIAGVTVAFVALAVVWTMLQTKVYTAEADVLVKPPIVAASDTGGSTPALNIENERQVMLSLQVATLAARRVDLDVAPRTLLQSVDVTAVNDADVLEVRFSDPSPQIAAQGAQAFATSYLQYQTDQANAEKSEKAEAIQSQIDLAQTQGPSGQASIPGLRSQLADVLSTIVDPGEILIGATPPRSPTSPNMVMNVVLALLLGLLVGAIAAFIRERMDDRLRGRHDLEETMGAPVMTMIPSVPSWRDKQRTFVATLEAPRSPTAEAYRTLRTSILVAAAERGIKTLMVVSSMAGEGKSTTAANLAVVLAQADKRVVLMSADLRRPRIHEFFGLESGQTGLSEVLSGQRRAWESLRSGRIDNLWILSSGKVADHPTELLQSPAMAELIAEQRDVVDFILIDCPPVLAVADALVLAPLVDAVLFVADAESTPRGAVIQARAQLDQVGARVLGSVLNNVDAGTSGYAFYGAQYGYNPTGTAPAPNGKGANVWEQLRKDRPIG